MDAQSYSRVNNSRWRVIVASLIGTTIEFYDFYIYATAAVIIFPKIFFPSGDPFVALLSSLAIFGAAFIARPFGAVFFGHFGDRYGRKNTLVATLLTMGIATFLIGFLPTYDQVGWLAPAMLTFLRLTQGFALGGEWSGAALIATENAPNGKRATYGTFPQLGAPLGFIIANGLFLLIAGLLAVWDSGNETSNLMSWGWRIPFYFSLLMIVIGIWVRFKLEESTAYTKISKAGLNKNYPLKTILYSHKKIVILGTANTITTYVLFYIMTIFSLTYATATINSSLPGLGYDYEYFVFLQIIGACFFALFTFISGVLSDKIGRIKVLSFATVLIIIFGATWANILSLGHSGLLIWLMLGFSLMGLTFGPIGALLPELFPTALRYTGSAIVVGLAAILGASLTPFISASLWKYAEGSPVLVGYYLALMSSITLISLILGKETKDVDIEN